MNKIKEFIKNTPTSVLTAITFLAILTIVCVILSPILMLSLFLTLAFGVSVFRVMLYVIEKK